VGGGCLAGYGSSVFAEMSALAEETGSINLGQGFPDEDGPVEVLEAATEAIRSGHNQYPPSIGVPALRAAVAAHQRRFYALDYDPDTEVTVTAGATEAIAATVLSLCGPGDEVVTFEPYYDSYAAVVALAGATRRVVPLRPPGWTFDPDELARAVTPSTRLLLLNSPHNPTGRLFGPDDLAVIARLCVEHDLVAVTDEVYEHLVFDGTHVPLATLPGMRDRTARISSAAKTFAVTGWKVGWVSAPPQLTRAIRSVKQFLTFGNGTPFQHAVAGGLGLGDGFFTGAAAELRSRRDRLCGGLARLGWDVLEPAGTYFATVDVGRLAPAGDGADGWTFCRALAREHRVAAVPMAAFYDDAEAGRRLVRFAFCKRPEVLDEALARLAGVPVRADGPVLLGPAGAG
jgi:N-succinyldiaminopimelate aminotransferase